MKNRFSIYLLLALFLLSSSFKHAKDWDDYDVTVTGFLFGYNGSDKSTKPLTGARVELMDSDADGSTLFDDVMGVAYVDIHGFFSVSGKGGDPGDYSWSRPDVYIRVVFNNDQGVRLTDELDWDRYEDTPEHDHDNFEGVLDIGSWVTGTGVNDGDGTKPGVWIRATEVWDEYVSLIGAVPPSGKYDIEYWSAVYAGTPWTNTTTTHWPIHYSTAASKHEFGHLIRHAFDGDADHFAWDATRFRYARNHENPCDDNCNRIGGEVHSKGLGYGFNEGWAEFWAGENSICVNIDDECEGNVNHAFFNLRNLLGISRKKMVEVLQAHPYAIHSMDEFTHFLFEGGGAVPIELLYHEGKDLTNGPQFVKFPIIDIQTQTEQARRQMDESNKQLDYVAGQLAAAEKKASLILVCDSVNCYQTFQNLIRPSLLRAEYKIKKLALDRIAAITPERYRNMMTDGTIDKMMAKQKKIGRKQIMQINLAAFKEAISSVQKIKGKSQEMILLEKDLEKKCEKFKRSCKNKESMPLQANAPFRLPEDEMKPITK